MVWYLKYDSICTLLEKCKHLWNCCLCACVDWMYANAAILICFFPLAKLSPIHPMEFQGSGSREAMFYQASKRERPWTPNHFGPPKWVLETVPKKDVYHSVCHMISMFSQWKSQNIRGVSSFECLSLPIIGSTTVLRCQSSSPIRLQ